MSNHFDQARTLIQKDFFESNEDNIHNLTEKGEEKGEKWEMKLVLSVDTRTRCTHRFEKRFHAPFFKNLCCADSVVWEYVSQNQWNLHVFELKKTVTTGPVTKSRSWEHIKAQFHGAYLRCRMIAGLLGIQIAEIFFYTVFVYDEVNRSPSPSNEEGMENPADYHRARERWISARNSQKEWNSTFCEFGRNTDWPEHFGEAKFRHVKITLTKNDNEETTSYVGSHTISSPITN